MAYRRFFQRRGGPRMVGGPGLRRQRWGGPGIAQSLPRSSEIEGAAMDISLEDLSADVRVVGVHELEQVAFDKTAPLVVKGAVARVSKKWTDEWLLQRFGSGSFNVSLDSRPAMKPFKKQMALGEYLDSLEKSEASDQPPEYLFDTQKDLEGAADLLEDLDIHKEIVNLGNPTKWRLFVGPALSGTLPHNHTYAINALARGRKRWAIYVGTDRAETQELLAENYRDYGSGSQAKDWFVQEFPKLRSRNIRLWECVQEAGDLVYIPAFFIHAVVNLEPVAGFTVEFMAK